MRTEAVCEDKDKETEDFKEDKENDATTAVDRKTSQAQPNCTATSSSNVLREPDAVESRQERRG